ncbi:MAG: AgmX/PglI C-terminal domain-containing protein [Alphaproteobacteria bacterium]|nr:AgmX/PglI C-terminal domain-containing protein [Alphaproteobacteria bacterium]
MAICPFCDGTIEESLALHGGTCPHCFGHIPGEETATDPGEHVKAELAAADRARAEKRARAPLFLIAPVVLIAVGAAAWSLWPSPSADELVFDGDEFAIQIDLAEYVEPEVTAPPEAATPTPAKTSRPRTPSGSAAGSERVVVDNAAPAGSASAGAADGIATTDLGGPEMGDGLSFSVQRTAAVLESRDDIQNAVRDMFVAQQPRLTHCYERSLKSHEDLAGRWKLAFTIQTDGSVGEVAVTGLDMSEQGFEQCLVMEMSRWHLQGRLKKPWPVALPVSFKGNG